MNFRRILSKNSLKSSTSSGKSLSHSEEVSKLHTEIEFLKQTVESLKVSVESRDAAIGTLAREKEKLYVEFKSSQRTNRNLQQQLVDERDIHSKEKEYWIEEIKRLSKTNDFECNVYKDRIDKEQLNHSFKEEIKRKDEVIYNICAKYLKIKFSKRVLKREIEKQQQQSQKVCQNIILLLQENRHTLDNVLAKLIKNSRISPTSKQYLRLLKINTNLHYENTQLKICLSQTNFPEEDEEEKSEIECHQDGPDSHTRFSKSEGKIMTESRSPKIKVKHLSSYPRFCTMQYPKKSFKYKHATFSPYFRRYFFHAYSDPCLAQFK